MDGSLMHEAAAKLWKDKEFQCHFLNLKIENARFNLGINTQSNTEIKFENLLRAASIFSLIRPDSSESDKYHEAAFRIAYISAKIWKQKPDDFEKVIALLLTRIGNFPTIKKQLANDDLLAFFGKLLEQFPHSFALESIARYEGNTISINNDENLPRLELTDFQRMLWDGLENENRIISFSSPTSSGKTFLLQQFLINKATHSSDIFRSVYVVPTRALIAEISHSLRALLKQKKVTDVEVLSISSDLNQDAPSKVIYVFTQERLLSFLADTTPKKMPFINFVIVDEAQQIGEKARGTLLQQALCWLKSSYRVGKYVFCSPVISNPDLFHSLIIREEDPVSSENHTTKISPVAQNLHIVTAVKGKPDQLAVHLHHQIDGNLLLTNSLMLNSKRQDNSKAHFMAYCAYHLGRGKRNIIYVDDPSSADGVAGKLMEIFGSECTDPEIIDASTFISGAVHQDFCLAKAIRHRVGIHYGKMPSLVRETVERLFKEEKLDFLICTSTLAQGVNLPAQNLFILDPNIRSDNNVSESISKPAFWNIVGRAGRLYRDFEGNVFLLKKPSSKENWETQFLDGEKLSNITPATQSAIIDQRKELLEHITNPNKDAQKGIEEAASFIYDISQSGIDLKAELSWIPSLPQDVVFELKSSTDEAKTLITLPHGVIKKNVGVSPVRQQALYDFLSAELILDDWILPRSLSSPIEFHKIVYMILKYLDVPAMESEILKKYTWLYVGPAFDWVLGKPLNVMVNQHINFCKKRDKISEPTSEKTNSYIRDLFDQIENKVRFKLVKYINCYNNILLEVCHQKGRSDLIEKLPLHLALFLEVGASNPIQIDLISLGLSRMTAIELSKYITADSYNKDLKKLKKLLHALSKEKSEVPSICIKELQHYVL